MHLTLRATLLATLAVAAPSLSRAADVTPDQARALEGQLRAWFASVAGPDLPIASSPIQVTPEGDHFRLTVPPAGAAMPVKGWPTFIANARPAEAGRWTLDGVRMQSPATFTVDVVPSTKPGEKAAAPVPTTYTISYATQEGGGTWDPTFATPSVLNSNSTGFQMTSDGGGLRQVTKIERTTSASALRPVGEGRVDASVDVNGTGYSLQTKAADPASGVPAVQIAARQVKVVLGMAGVSRERSAQIIPALARLSPPAGAAPGAKAPPNPEAVRVLVQAMQGLASGVTMVEVLDDLTVAGTGFNFASTQLRLGMDAKADGGFMAGSMDIGLDGLALPGMGLDTFADLLPQRIALRPIVSNVPTQELLQLLQTSMEKPDGGTPPAQVAALFSHGALKTGLESFAVDIGGASFAGKASVEVSSPNQASGTAQVTATNVDALLAKVQANPALAQAIPAIVFAKGIGRTEGGRMVWDMSFDKGKLLVNGVDLTKMGGK